MWISSKLILSKSPQKMSGVYVKQELDSKDLGGKNIKKRESTYGIWADF